MQLSKQKSQETNDYEINRKLASVSFQPWETSSSPFIRNNDHKAVKTVKP